MTEESMITVLQGDIDGELIVRQHKEYYGRDWFQSGGIDKWDFMNYYYRILKKGETYKNWSNKTLVYGEDEKAD